MHGLSIWASIMTYVIMHFPIHSESYVDTGVRYFTKHSSKKAAAGKNKARHGIRKARANFSRSTSSQSRTLSERGHSSRP